MSRVYIDTNIFIGAFEANDDTSRQIRLIFDAFETKPKMLVTSEITLAEIGARDLAGRRLAHSLPTLQAFIDFIPVARDIVLGTCDYRLQLKTLGKRMKLPDAIHCVTAVRAGCAFVLTADQRFWLPPDLRRIAPDLEGFLELRSILDA